MPNILSLKNITRICGDNVYANRNVSLDLFSESIHALVGENGAGKTTLMNVLFGLVPKDAGEIYYKEELVHISSPMDAKKLKIAMVHQHFMLANNLTVRDHLILEINSSEKIFGFYSRTNFEKKIIETMRVVDLKINLNEKIENLSVIQKQKLEILKILLFDPQILIFDEPTAVLPPEEVERFYNLLLNLKKQGRSIVVITHKLQDVMKYSDRVTVLRHGEVKYTAQTKAASAEIIAQYMIGEVVQTKKYTKSTGNQSSKAILTVKNFSITETYNHKKIKNVSLSVMEGEIVSFAGVECNGQNELIHYVMFPEQVPPKKSNGEIQVLGKVYATSQEIRKLPVGFIGEDRLHDSAITEFDVQNHFRLLPKIRKDFFLKPLALDVLNNLRDKFDIRPKSTSLKIGRFSGGNQQKWVVARETSQSPQLLIANHPTRGVDFSAAEKIYSVFNQLRSENKSVILISSDIDEILNLSDRIFVFFDGQMIQEFKPPFDRHKIGKAFGGHI